MCEYLRAHTCVCAGERACGHVCERADVQAGVCTRRWYTLYTLLDFFI